MRLTGSGIALRFLFAVLLVLLSYNPSGYSYFHWAYHNISMITPYIAIAGLVLLIGWAVYLKATLNSLGIAGILLAGALFACLIWLLIYWKVLDIHNSSAIAWIVEILLALLLATGMCWSHITLRWSGQVDVDDIDEN
jgi:tetrahydromethanopterin S-methyltransferase subunit F